MRKRTCEILGMAFLLNVVFSVCLFGQVKEWEKQLKKEPGNTEVLLNLGKYYYNNNVDFSEDKAMKKAENYFLKLLEIEPKNGTALVYHGSLLSIKARDASSQADQFEYVNKGIAKMDKAVFYEPDNPEVRLLRAVNGTNMPDFLGRLPLALEDFEHIKKLNRNKKLNQAKRFWLPYYYYYGLALNKNNETEAAKKMFQEAVKTDPEAALAKEAKSELKKISG